MIVSTQQTGGYDVNAWITRSFVAARGVAVVAIPLTDVYDNDQEGSDDRDAMWNAIAACAVMAWALATGGGGLEYNNNPGLVPCPTSPSDGVNCMTFTAANGGETFRAFDTLADGAAGWFAWVRAASTDAWELLSQGGLDFLDRFQRATHRGAATVDQAVAWYNRIVGMMPSVPAVEADELAALQQDWHPVDANRNMSRVTGVPVVPGIPAATAGGGSGGSASPGGGTPSPAPATASTSPVVVGGILAGVAYALGFFKL